MFLYLGQNSCEQSNIRSTSACSLSRSRFDGRAKGRIFSVRYGALQKSRSREIGQIEKSFTRRQSQQLRATRCYGFLRTSSLIRARNRRNGENTRAPIGAVESRGKVNTESWNTGKINGGLERACKRVRSAGERF